MKRLHGHYIWVVVCYLLFAHTAVAEENLSKTTNASSAADVIRQYFSVLEQGDTTGIQNLLGGVLLKSRERLLSNPVYPETLRQLYRDASFSIIGTKVVNAKRVTVDVEVSWIDNRRMQLQFQLQKSTEGNFLIHAEDEIL